MKSDGEQAQRAVSKLPGVLQRVSSMFHEYVGVIYAHEEDETNAAGGEEELIAEEVEAVSALPSPTLPRKANIDDHWLDHLPFRSWCGACVGGRGHATPHRRVPGKRLIPTLALDYCFVNKNWRLPERRMSQYGG